ncbi:MAG: ABC transporter permease [Acidobacteriia bacterium]|nr:ABC transporter permease [Terriglobia bacterium]
MLKPLRHAFRVLFKTPGFTLVAICSLAIGIGATSAMFSFADALLLRPLPVREPSTIVAVNTVASAALGSNTAVSYPDYRDLRDGNHSVESLLAASFSSFGFARTAVGLPKITFGMFVSGNFFRTLGVQPASGRDFLDSEDQAVGRNPVVVLGHDFWKAQYGSSPAAVGSSIWLNGVQCTIVGVAPEQFTGIDQFIKPSLFVPLAMSPRLSQANNLERRDIRWLTVKGRLKPGVSVAQAHLDLSAIGARLEQMYPQTDRNQRIQVQTEFQFRVRQSPPNAALVAMLFVLALCVLLVACANVTGLLLSRARARTREMAVRLAIGAGRGALVRQLMLENLLLALFGGVAGIAIAYLGTSFLNGIPIPTDVPLDFHVSVDRRMLFFTIAASLVSTFLFGLTPALQTTRLNLVPALKTADADSGGKRRLWGRNLIVIGQVALSLVLLIVSAVLLRGFQDELTAGPGFRTDHLYLTSFDTGPVHYSDDQTRRFYRDLLEKIRLAPGVRSAALTTNVPMMGGLSEGIVPEGYVMPRGEQSITVFNYYVSDDYFSTMGIPLLRGRGFLDSDRGDTPRVAVINAQCANHFWPRQDAIGKRFHLNSATGPVVEIVGIAKNSKYFWIAEPPLDFIYLPYTQTAPGQGGAPVAITFPALTLFAESSEPSAANLASVVREVVRRIDPNMPVHDERTMQDYYSQRAVKTPNMIAQSVAALGLLGLILATAGLYGLIAYSVSRRFREIGIRMALGADRRSVVRMVLRQGLTLGLIGVAAGLVLSFLACRALTSAIWVASFSSLNYALFPAIAVPLLLITLLATYAPARRASQIDPMRALREE